MWKDLPFLVKVIIPPSHSPAPPIPFPHSLLTLLIPATPLLVKDGVIFSIDTIKSKASPNYQAVL